MKKLKKEKIKEILMAIFVLIIVLLIGIEVTINYVKGWEKECDDKYGKNNWELIETTGKHPFYIGQTWECVSK